MLKICVEYSFLNSFACHSAHFCRCAVNGNVAMVAF